MEIVMPRVGLTMTEGAIAQWHKREGDIVRKGDVLFTFETEKSSLEYESPTDGVLSKILVPIGQTVACLTPVAVIGEATTPMPTSHSPLPTHESEVESRESASATQSSTLNTQNLGRRPISPRARMRARELGVDPLKVEGTGPDGSVRERDVLRVAAGFTPAHSNLQSLSPVRRITAQRMTESARIAPHVTLTTEADATELVSAREQLMVELGEKVSYNALLVAICARALKEYPYLNASWAEETTGDRRQTTEGSGVRRQPPIQSGAVVIHEAIHIGLAVDTPRGLFVPVLRDAGAKSLAQIHHELNALVARTLEGKVTPDESSGGTFTLTNLGMYEIDAFTPIVNLPEAAILGVGRIAAKPVAKGEQVVVRLMMALSLSFDHRVVDGAPAAKFLQRIKQLIERPFALLT
jgi:pyruvate dehydrogenase E2 component (dihydrolipoamide acetyltransferase)